MTTNKLLLILILILAYPIMSVVAKSDKTELPTSKDSSSSPLLNEEAGSEPTSVLADITNLPEGQVASPPSTVKRKEIGLNTEPSQFQETKGRLDLSKQHASGLISSSSQIVGCLRNTNSLVHTVVLTLQIPVSSNTPMLSFLPPCNPKGMSSMTGKKFWPRDCRKKQMTEPLK
jgi:hypothetical protein